MSTKERRGGPRRRRYALKRIGAIDHEAISTLLVKLAPHIAQERRDLALTIVVKGIETFREHAPGKRALIGTAQQNRRALGRFNKGKTRSAVPPFNSFASFQGKLYGASSAGVFRIEGEPNDGPRDEYGELEKPLVDPLRALAIVHQLAAGLECVNPNIPCNPPSINAEGRTSTVADVILHGLVHPRDWEAELAGYAYLAISRALSIRASLDWFEEEPKRMRLGWNFGRLLKLAAIQAGASAPASRDGMRGLMRRGKACAEDMLSPAIRYADGRTISFFSMEFPEA